METAGNRSTFVARAFAAALLCVATSCAAADKPGYCIVSNNAIGCISQDALSDIVDYNGNLRGLRGTIAEKLGSGLCELFEFGERVYVTATDGGERSAVRRPGEDESYWMPSSWSRPAAECAANASPQSLGKKIGMPVPGRIEPYVPPPKPVFRQSSAPLPVSRHCVYKSVMTDADIRACRRAARRPMPIRYDD